MSDRELIPFGGELRILPEGPGPKPSWVIDSDGLVYLRCPHGYICGSPFNHTIDADGTVNASIVGRHSKTECNWHVFGRLLEWIDGPIAPGKAKIAALKRQQLIAAVAETELEDGETKP